jgi:hypothetical protein
MDKEEYISNSDSENEEEIKYQFLEEEIQEDNKQNININMTITTDGINETDESYYKLEKSLQNLLNKCSMCQKLYDKNMINNLDDSYNLICWHCFFWINYDVSLRSQCDGTHGLTIVEYVLKCRKDHNTNKCTRNSDSGGCFLCENIIGLDILNIIDGEKINQDQDKNTSKVKVKLNFEEQDPDQDNQVLNNLKIII